MEKRDGITNRLRWNLWITVCLAWLAGLMTTSAAGRPNILFIFADDQCFETIRAFGHTDIDTPNLDRLAHDGVTFTRAYNMGSWSGAVCVASRTMLNTGRFLWHARRVYDSAEKERTEGRFWSEYLRRAGYATYLTGKWHVPATANRAFDLTAHIRGGMPDQTPEGYNRPILGQPDVWKPWDKQFGGFWEGGTHWSEVVANDTSGFMETASSDAKPFFMYVAFNAAHDPRQSPRDVVEKYPLDRIEVPANYIAEYPYKDGIGCGPSLRDEKLMPFPRTEYAVKVNRQEYYALITHMDAQIGRILDALQRSGKAENTYIFFTADHGLAVGHHGLVGKQNLYEHSTRVPFIVTGPDVPKGKTVDAPIYLQDVMPTTLELAGVDKPDHVEFNSLLPLIRGQTTRSAYDAIYGAYLHLQRSVTWEGHKLILYPGIQKTRLYDLERDPLEMNDLAEEASQMDRMKMMFKRLLALQRETGDTLGLAGIFPQLN